MSHDAQRDLRLAQSRKGPSYWRSLEEQAQAAEFRAWLDQEFPVLAGQLQEAERRGATSRRQFLRLMAASMALAGVSGLTGCRQPPENILPYGQKPEEIIPGLPLYYATTMVLAGWPLGLLVETHEGRPTKIEGHPEHPLSRGATHAWAQASVLELYDPDRSRFVVHRGQPSSWDEFLAFWDGHIRRLRATAGEGLAILSEEDASPVVQLLREKLVAALPQARWHTAAVRGCDRRPPQLTLDQADIILSLDCDLLNTEDAGVVQRQAVAQKTVDGRAGWSHEPPVCRRTLSDGDGPGGGSSTETAVEPDVQLRAGPRPSTGCRGPAHGRPDGVGPALD